MPPSRKPAFRTTGTAFLAVLLIAGTSARWASAQGSSLSTDDRERIELAITAYFNPSTITPASTVQGLSSIVVKDQNSGTGGPSDGTPPAARTYAVQSGDSLSEIAYSYGLSNANLYAANQQLTDSSVIQPGQVLTLPSSAVSDDQAAKVRQQRVAAPAAKSALSAPVTATSTPQPTVTPTDGSYQVPVPYTYESQGFSSFHPGIDMVAPLGTPIHATKAGCIISAGGGWNGGYGTLITQDIGNGYSARYAHLTRIADGIQPGACVAQGAVIGYVGSTGNSTGPHLHFELRLNGVAFNPAL